MRSSTDSSALNRDQVLDFLYIFSTSGNENLSRELSSIYNGARNEFLFFLKNILEPQLESQQKYIGLSAKLRILLAKNCFDPGYQTVIQSIIDDLKNDDSQLKTLLPVNHIEALIENFKQLNTKVAYTQTFAPQAPLRLNTGLSVAERADIEEINNFSKSTAVLKLTNATLDAQYKQTLQSQLLDRFRYCYDKACDYQTEENDEKALKFYEKTIAAFIELEPNLLLEDDITTAYSCYTEAASILIEYAIEEYFVEPYSYSANLARAMHHLRAIPLAHRTDDHHEKYLICTTLANLFDLREQIENTVNDGPITWNYRYKTGVELLKLGNYYRGSLACIKYYRLALSELDLIPDNHLNVHHKQLVSYILVNSFLAYADAGANACNESDYEDAITNLKIAFTCARQLNDKYKIYLSEDAIQIFDAKLARAQRYLAHCYYEHALQNREAGKNDQAIKHLTLARDLFAAIPQKYSNENDAERMRLVELVLDEIKHPLSSSSLKP